jgi:hypothetical protein
MFVIGFLGVFSQIPIEVANLSFVFVATAFHRLSHMQFLGAEKNEIEQSFSA